MPEVFGDDFRPIEDSPAEEVKLPDTPEERHKLKLEMLAKETDDQRSERRVTELKRHIDVHMENVKDAHEKYPAPVHRDFGSMSEVEQKNWNARRSDIDMANRAYHLAIRRTCEEHKAEEAHLSQLRNKGAA